MRERERDLGWVIWEDLSKEATLRLNPEGYGGAGGIMRGGKVTPASGNCAHKVLWLKETWEI